MATLTKLTSLDRSAATAEGALAIDADGNLFGIAFTHGNSGSGVIYEVPKTATGYASTATVLFDHTGPGFIRGQLVVDSAGNLFGTDIQGVVYELARTPEGYAGAPTVIATFGTGTGTARGPGDTLVMDADGNLFGTTQYGGIDDRGAVFEVVKTATGYADTPVTLATFTMATGEDLRSKLYIDAAGNLFGTTGLGGTLYPSGEYGGEGTVFEIARTPGGYATTPTVLARFGTNPGSLDPQLESPNGGLVADADGNLFGTIPLDFDPDTGQLRDNGVIFEIVRTADGYDPTPKVLHRFNGLDGAVLVGGPIIDARGNLFGVTSYSLGSDGMGNSSGTVYELAKTADGYADEVTRLGTFHQTDGAFPLGPLVVDGTGNLFGAATFGGQDSYPGYGAVFEVTDSGFAVACFCRGTRIRTPEGEVAVEALAPGDAVVTAGGTVQRIRWVGRRSYGGRFLAGQHRLLPIRFRAGSLGGGLPRRDLLVSPGHAMFLDGVLVAARTLVNGITITRERGAEQVHYHHVELDRHDVLLAEGAPSESFVDDDSRGMFHNAAEWDRAHPSRARVPAVFCAPRVDSGPALDRIRQRLASLARRSASSPECPESLFLKSH